jgi:YVTN family beta-propeller protein
MSHDIALPVTEPKGPVEDAIDLSAPQRLRPDYFAPPQVIQGPLTSDAFTNVPFADLPLYIPGLTQSVVGFNGGINKAALDVHREKGLLCNLLPYLDMADGDFIELFCRDLLVPVDSYNITQDDVDKARMIPLYIPRTRLPDGPVNPVFMRVTRVGGAAEETQRLNLKVDTVPPAGRNPIGSTLHNENLPVPMFPQKIIDYGVSDDDAIAGVPVTFKFYPADDTQEPSTFRATRDRIRLRINGIDPELPPLTENQAAGREEITYTLSHGFWVKVRSGLHVCEYEVIDEVGNASLGWSPALLLDVRLNDQEEPFLPEAFILEAANNILNHDDLKGRDATTFITTRSPDFALGDSIRVTVRGRADGGLITTTYDSPPLTSLSFITLALPNADLQPFITGQFQLFYERIRTGTTNRKSENLIVRVTGTPIERRLRPPVVLEASGGILDPQSLFVNVVVRAYPEQGQAPSDRVDLFLYGTKANGDPVYDELYDLAGTGDVLFKINNGPNGKIASLEGGTLRLRYNVVNKDGTRPSEDVTLNVGDVVASMPEPLVVEAPAPLYQFDPEKHTGNARILVKSNTDFLLNDTVTLHCKGTAPGGSAPDKPLLIEPQWLGIDLPFTLERQYITANLNKTMRIYYTRKRENTLTRISHEVNMKVGSRLELKAPTVLEATVTGSNQASLNPLHVLPPHRPVVTIRVVSDKFPAGSDIKVFIVGKPGVGMPNITAAPATPEPGENYVSFTVPHAFVGAYLGGKCTVYYNLIEIGKTTKSDELTLHVQALPAQEWDLVSVPQAAANGGMIDTSKAHDVRIDEWPFIRYDRDIPQPVWVDAHGTANQVLRNGIALTPEEFTAKRILMPIPADYLRKLDDGSGLDIKAYVSLDGSGSRATAVPFKPVSYRVKRQAGIIGSIEVGAAPKDIIMSPDGARVYVANTSNNSISFIDTATNKVIYTFFGGNTMYPGHLAISPDGSTLYVTSSIFATQYVYPLWIIDTYNFTGRAVSGFNNPNAVAISTDGQYAYIGDNYYNWSSYQYYTLIRKFDTTENFKEVSSMSVTGITYDLILNPNETRLYAVIFSNLNTIDLATNAIVNSLPDIDMTSMAYSPHAARIYGTSGKNYNSKFAFVVNTATSSLLRKFTLQGKSEGLAINPVREVAYFPQSEDNSIQLIDTRTDELSGVIRGFSKPSGIAVTSDGGVAYVSNENTGVVSIVAL